MNDQLITISTGHNSKWVQVFLLQEYDRVWFVGSNRQIWNQRAKSTIKKTVIEILILEHSLLVCIWSDLIPFLFTSWLGSNPYLLYFHFLLLILFLLNFSFSHRHHPRDDTRKATNWQNPFTVAYKRLCMLGYQAMQKTFVSKSQWHQEWRHTKFNNPNGKPTWIFILIQIKTAGQRKSKRRQTRTKLLCEEDLWLFA